MKKPQGKPKRRNPVAKDLFSDDQFRHKVVSVKKDKHLNKNWKNKIYQELNEEEDEY